MACITKLANAIAYDCDSGSTGLVSALIINKADIAGFSLESGTMTASGVTLAAGAKAYKIDTIKRSLVLSTALKVNEGAPNAYSHSATLVYTGILDAAGRKLVTALTNGSFVIVAKTAKPAQDNRFDMPSVGTKTLESMIKAGAAGLVMEAGRTLLVDREKTLAMANEHNITIVAK